MDVDKLAFPHYLLEILEALSQSHFVALDFEFSGVVSKPPSRQKQTLQERYAETKQAAEKYQIIQAGLTCAIHDEERQAYILRTFNIPICPTFDEDLDIERQFSFQSGAVEFLLRNRFNFDVTFSDGVPYLNCDEEAAAKRKLKERARAKNAYQDIHIPEEDVKTRGFLNKIRGEIDEWVKMGTQVNLTLMSRTEHWKDCEDADLTSFDRRLIHQLVRAEYPGYMTLARGQMIIVKIFDEEREEEFQQRKYKDLKKKMYRQRGFSWVIKAMAGASLQNIDISWFATDPKTGASGFYEPAPYQARFWRSQDHLQRRRPVLVGHNCFTDLIYLHQQFVGMLPDTIEEFTAKIHNLFPVVIDTKYLFTHDCGNLNPASSLDQIENALRLQAKPTIVTHEDHTKYDGEDMYHEAGFDSYLTARVAILLSAKLEAQGIYILDSENKQVQSKPREQHQAPESSLPGEDIQSKEAPLSIDSPAEMASKTPGQTSVESKLTRLARRKKPLAVASPSPPQKPTKFTSTNPFAALLVSAENAKNAADGGIFNEPATSSVSQDGQGLSGSRTGHMSPSHSDDLNAARERQDTDPSQPKLDKCMPPWDSDFWRVYGNRLRIFGTEEGILDLDPTRS